MIGFGTKPDTPIEALQVAINSGYIMIDTKDSNSSLQHFKLLNMDRQKLFISSKLMGESSPTNHNPENVFKACANALEKSGLTYFDLYYIHTTYSFNNVNILHTYSELIKLKQKGIIKNIGLSNVIYEQLESIIINSAKPDYIQIEIHPYLTEERIVDYCKSHNINVVAHSPLGSSFNSQIVKEPLLVELSKKYNMSVEQVILSWHVSRGIIPIPSSKKQVHIENNLKIVTLLETEIQGIFKLNKNMRGWVKPNHYESIGKICSPLPKRIINSSELINDNTPNTNIINDLILKGFYICNASIDNDLYRLSVNLKDRDDSSHIKEIQDNIFLNSIVSKYLNKSNYKKLCSKRNTGPSVNFVPKSTQLFHRDTQLQKCIKVIIYLTEVTSVNGPLKIIYPEPDIHVRWFKDSMNARCSYEEITKVVPKENIISVEGPEYTMIIFEGTTLHAGGFVQKGSRKIIYIEFN